MTTRQLMLLVVFAAFAFLGPLPLIRPVMQTPGMQIGQRLDLIVMLATFGVVMGALSCLAPTLLFLRGNFQLWVFRLLLAFASLVMAGTLAGICVWMFLQWVPRLPLLPSGKDLIFLFAILFGSLSAFVVILIHFWKRIIPRTCPICGRRRLILRRTDRVRADVSFGSGSLRKSGHGEVETLGRSLTHKRRQWSCLSCGAEDTILVGRSMTEASELAGSEFS